MSNQQPQQPANTSVKLITGNDELRNRLQTLATQDFDAFLAAINVDGVQVSICSDRSKQLSYEQIAIRLRAAGFEITRQSVADRCKKCQETPDTSELKQN